MRRRAKLELGGRSGHLSVGRHCGEEVRRRRVSLKGLTGDNGCSQPCSHGRRFGVWELERLCLPGRFDSSNYFCFGYGGRFPDEGCGSIIAVGILSESGLGTGWSVGGRGE